MRSYQWVIGCVVLLCPFFTYAQQRTDANNRRAEFENFKARREAYITKEVNLTAEEATVFWPICNELMEKKYELNRNNRRDMRAIYTAIRNGEKVSDADYNQIITINAEIKIKEAELDKEYLIRLRKVLPAEKVFKYQRAEQRFAREMINTAPPDRRRE